MDLSPTPPLVFTAKWQNKLSRQLQSLTSSFVVDARAGVSAQDHDIAKYLRRLSKPCILIANKAEGMVEGVQLLSFMS